MLDAFRLPAFAGSMFRGCLGWALQDVCSASGYRYLFETSSDQSGQQDAARPFVLLPPLDQRELRRDDRFVLELHLFGQACEFVSTFVSALQRMGRAGLGSTQARFELTRITSLEGRHRWVCYDVIQGWQRAYIPQPVGLGAFANSVPEGTATSLELDFVTPTRLVHQGRPVQIPEFHITLRALARRLQQLLQHHGDTALDADVPGWIREAGRVQLVSDQTRWQDWERTSARQQRKHVMGGLVGRATYEGQFPVEWLEMLSVCRVLHLGKATTFGMGRVVARTLELQLDLPAPPPLLRRAAQKG